MMKKHSILSMGLLTLLLTTACGGEKKATNEFPPMGHLTADSISVPPVLMSVNRLFITDDVLVAYEQKKDTMFSFWQLPHCEYLFSAGIKGGGPNDFMNIDRSFGSTDEGFKAFEMSAHKVKDMRINKQEKRLETVGVQALAIEEMANRFLYLADGNYCYMTMMKENAEYALYNANTHTSRYFSPYPEGLLQKGSNELNAMLYNKLTVSHPDGKRFAAFYGYVKLCRIYDHNGNLLNETLLDSPAQPTVPLQRKALYVGFPSADNDYIYILAEGDKEENILEIWDWDGNPVAHYQLNKSFNDYVIYPKNNKLYAVDDKRDDGVVYTYDLP